MMVYRRLGQLASLPPPLTAPLQATTTNEARDMDVSRALGMLVFFFLFFIIIPNN